MKLTKIQIETLKAAMWEFNVVRNSPITAGRAGIFNLHTCRALAKRGLLECVSENIDTNQWVDFLITPLGQEIPEVKAYWQSYVNRHTGKNRVK